MILLLSSSFIYVYKDVRFCFQATRIAAMDCIEKLYKLWCQVDFSSKKNGMTYDIFVSYGYVHLHLYIIINGIDLLREKLQFGAIFLMNFWA